MSNPGRSLNASIDRQRLLAEFEVPCPSRSLPADVLCPLCNSGLMRIYADHVAGGEWSHCQDCGFAGDMIQLASRTWSLSIEATIAKLARLGLTMPTDIAVAARNYVNGHFKPQARLQELWAQAAQGLTNPSGEVQRLVHQFNLHCSLPPDRRLAGPGSLLGAMSTTEVERAFAPGAMQHADEKGQQSNPSEHAVFRGAGWRDTLVIPFCDLPQRISGFLFVGRKGEYPQDFVFRRANRGFGGNQWGRPPGEAGLALHPLVVQEGVEWGRTVVAIGKPLLALSLQMRHLEQSQLPLPLVTWYDSITRRRQHGDGQRVRTINSWEMLGNMSIVFWMPAFCASTLQQAITSNGLISTVGPREAGTQALQEYLWKFTPRDLMRHIIQSAKPWPVALNDALRQMSDSDAERQLRRLRACGADVGQISRRCDFAMRQRIDAVFAVAGQRSAKLCGGPLIVERSGNWYARKGACGEETLVADAVMRVDRLLHHSREGKIYVRGRIIHQNTIVHFCEPQERIEKEGFAWMQNVLIRGGVDVLTYDVHYQRRLLQISHLFQRPTFAVAVDRVGWDEDGLQFTLPNFTVRSGGAVGRPDNAIFSGRPPARCLQAPEDELTPEELDRGAANDYPTQLYWATLACLLANIVAPACQATTAAIGLYGAGAESMGQMIAQAIGCLELSVTHAGDVQRARVAEQTHGWPLYVRQFGRLQRRTRRLLLQGDYKPRNIITALQADEIEDPVVRQEWQVVCGETPAACSDRLSEYAGRFVPAYLQHICTNRLSLDSWNNPLESHVHEVLRDMARFVAEQGGEPDGVMAAADLLRTPVENWAYSTDRNDAEFPLQ